MLLIEHLEEVKPGAIITRGQGRSKQTATVTGVIELTRGKVYILRYSYGNFDYRVEWEEDWIIDFAANYVPDELIIKILRELGLPIGSGLS